MTSPRERADELISRGFALEEAEDLEGAADAYREAAAVDPSYSAPCFNLGLLAKDDGDWESCAFFNREAVGREADNRSAWWNLGIAATALGDWSLARLAWRGFGLEVPDGEGPLDLPCGPAPVRLDPGGTAEVIWGTRIDPARVRLASIPFPATGFRFGDIVLNDGSPNGTRTWQGQEYMVFDVIERLVPSAHETFLVEVRCPHDVETRRLIQEKALDLGGAAEDWSHSVRRIDRAASLGSVDASSTAPHTDAQEVRTLALAATSEAHARAVCAVLAATVPGLSVIRVESAAAPDRGSSQRVGR